MNILHKNKVYVNPCAQKTLLLNLPVKFISWSIVVASIMVLSICCAIFNGCLLIITYGNII